MGTEMKRSKRKSKQNKYLELVKKAVSFVGRSIWWRRKLLILECPLKETSELEKKQYSHVHLKSFSGADGLKLIDDHFPQKKKLFRERIATSELQGWGIFNGDTPIGYLWASTGTYYEPSLKYRIFLTSKECYLFDGIIYPEFREGALPVYVNKLAWEILLSAGYKTSIALVNAENRRALLYHYRQGYKERFQQVEAPLLCNQPLKASMRGYVDSKLSRSALLAR